MKNTLILFYDGDCGFCNRSVSFVLKKDKTKKIFFAKLESDFTKKTFNKNNWNLPDMSTLYFIDNGVLFKKSSAILRISCYLKMPYNFLFIFKIIPKFLRDYMYEFVSKRRNKIANRFCFIPSKDQKNRFIA